MLCKRIKRMLSGLHSYLLPAGQRAEAVAVGYDTSISLPTSMTFAL